MLVQWKGKWYGIPEPDQDGPYLACLHCGNLNQELFGVDRPYVATMPNGVQYGSLHGTNGPHCSGCGHHQVVVRGLGLDEDPKWHGSLTAEEEMQMAQGNEKDPAWISGDDTHRRDGTRIIVAHCPRCAAPVYAPSLWVGAEPPPVYHTCDCRKRLWAWFGQPNIPDPMVEDLRSRIAYCQAMQRDEEVDEAPEPLGFSTMNDARNAKQATSDAGPTFRVGPWLMHTKWIDPLPM